ncbi:hypothetical protein Ae201684P_022349 [Aphanomyces euteiches]|nr:hypothetical protein Ae201684P_022349 [Aphanomyces euteiches]
MSFPKMTKLWQALGLRVSIIQAPMAGVSTPDLVAKVAANGALGSFSAGVLSPGEVRANLDELVRLVPDKRFNVNLFVETAPNVEDTIAQWNAYEKLLGPVRSELHLDPRPQSFPDEKYQYTLDANLALVQEYRPSVVSFCFGVLDRAVVRDLQAFAFVVGTATSVEEGIILAEAGVDAIVAQAEAGGHRSSFLHPAKEALIGSMSLIPQLCDAVKVPIIAAGGITDHRHVQAALALGAEAVQVGSAFIATPESNASPAWKAAMGPSHSSTSSVVTRGLTGRHARMLRNDLVDLVLPQEECAASSGIQRRRMREIFAKKDGRYASLLAGQSHRLCHPETSVEDVLARLTQP